MAPVILVKAKLRVYQMLPKFILVMDIIESSVGYSAFNTQFPCVLCVVCIE